MKKSLILIGLIICSSTGCVIESILGLDDDLPEIIIYDYDASAFERAVEQYRNQKRIFTIDTIYIAEDILTIEGRLEESIPSLKFKLVTSNVWETSNPPIVTCFLLLPSAKASQENSAKEFLKLSFDLSPIKRRFGKDSLPAKLSVHSRPDIHKPGALVLYEGN